MIACPLLYSCVVLTLPPHIKIRVISIFTVLIGKIYHRGNISRAYERLAQRFDAVVGMLTQKLFGLVEAVCVAVVVVFPVRILPHEILYGFRVIEVASRRRSIDLPGSATDGTRLGTPRRPLHTGTPRG